MYAAILVRDFDTAGRPDQDNFCWRPQVFSLLRVGCEASVAVICTTDPSALESVLITEWDGRDLDGNEVESGAQFAVVRCRDGNDAYAYVDVVDETLRRRYGVRGRIPSLMKGTSREEDDEVTRLSPIGFVN
ncbi:uncharacterized protein ARMOST_19080 [Armillaria ostoyae]|uniref:Uncharacterized protein n=1 Tax=Armillaria ostoyae TaxID=47428 RepID=A0A284S3L2_ARMOS|nr:uncharacterized protein ARMOST_19080 [Armillaria ostoyae]